MKIQTFSDGYVLTYKGEDFKYKGKEDYVLKMISDKIHDLLKKERDEWLKKIMRGEHNE